MKQRTACFGTCSPRAPPRGRGQVLQRRCSVRDAAGQQVKKETVLWPRACRGRHQRLKATEPQNYVKLFILMFHHQHTNTSFKFKLETFHDVRTPLRVKGQRCVQTRYGRRLNKLKLYWESGVDDEEATPIRSRRHNMDSRRRLSVHVCVCVCVCASGGQESSG